MAPSVSLAIARPQPWVKHVKDSILTNDFNKQDNKSLKDLKNETNPSQLGDPVSLKAETSNNQPTEKDKPNEQKSLKEMAQQKNETNPSMLGDPVSLKAETSDNEPTKDDRGTLGTGNERKNVGSGKPKM